MFARLDVKGLIASAILVKSVHKFIAFGAVGVDVTLHF